MTAVPVSPEDRAVMQKAAVEIVDRWQKRLPPEGRPIYEKVKAMVDEHNAKKK
jgi:TRAP-type C4-dicarboxylate transport system substrate-binding protein